MLSSLRDDFFSERRPMARRGYVCAHCRKEIVRGSRYVRISMRSGGQHAQHIAHMECYDAVTRPDWSRIGAVTVGQLANFSEPREGQNG